MAPDSQKILQISYDSFNSFYRKYFVRRLVTTHSLKINTLRFRNYVLIYASIDYCIFVREYDNDNS